MIFLPASSRFQRTRSPSPEFLYTPTWSSGGQSTVQGRPSARTHARHRGRCLPASERRPNNCRGDGSAPFLARSTSLQDQSSPETGGYPASWPPWPGTGGCPVSQPPWLGSGTPCEEEGPEVGVVVGLRKRRRPIEWGRLGYIGRRTFGRWATLAAPLAGRLAGPRGCLGRAPSTPPGWLVGCQAAGPAGSPFDSCLFIFSF
jgi:hypothetical protein